MCNMTFKFRFKVQICFHLLFKFIQVNFKFAITIKIKFKEIVGNINIVNRIAGQRKMVKLHDAIENSLIIIIFIK